MRILIVLPKFVGQPGQYYLLPVGLPYISAALKQAGLAVECLNLNHEASTPEELIPRIIRERQIDLVLTGGLSAHYHAVRQVLEAARMAGPHLKTMIGGGLLSSEPELIMGALRPDIGVIGEGEDTVVETVRALSQGSPLENVAGLIFWEAPGRLRQTPARPAIRDLDRISFPDYEGFGVDQYLDLQLPNTERDFHPFDNPRRLSIISSRSCPYNCTFCYHPIGNVYRQRSLDNLFQEIEYLKNRFRINMLIILDELFSMDHDRLYEFCRRMKPLGLKWEAQIRVDNIDRDMLATMKDSGCYCISYGLESGSDVVLKSMRKNIRVEQIKQALEMTWEAGIGVQGNFLFGDPAETTGTAAETLDLWLQLKKHNIYMVPVELYPGTGLYKKALEKGVIQDRLAFIEAGCPIENLTGMSQGQFLQTLLLMHLLRKVYQSSPARLLALQEQAGMERHGRRLLRMRVQCPHCNQVVEYGNMDLSGHRKIGCRACNRRFDLASLHDPYYRPLHYELSCRYQYQPEHAQEIRDFLDLDRKSWLVAEKVRVDRHDRTFKMIRLLGNLFLVPELFTAQEIRDHKAPLFILDSSSQKAYQLHD